MNVHCEAHAICFCITVSFHQLYLKGFTIMTAKQVLCYLKKKKCRRTHRTAVMLSNSDKDCKHFPNCIDAYQETFSPEFPSLKAILNIQIGIITTMAS